jgi:hypothetical protein
MNIDPLGLLGDLDTNWLLLSLIPSAIGFVLFVYGKAADPARPGNSGYERLGASAFLCWTRRSRGEPEPSRCWTPRWKFAKDRAALVPGLNEAANARSGMRTVAGQASTTGHQSKGGSGPLAPEVALLRCNDADNSLRRAERLAHFVMRLRPVTRMT